MKVAIVGYGTEGRQNYEYWLAKGADITICDQDPSKDIPKGVASHLGQDYLKGLGDFDIIVRTAGINPHLITDTNPGTESKITTAIDEFMHVCPTTNVIGVTGTKGKGTTTTLISKMLEAAGLPVFLGGNIGVPPFEFLSLVTYESWVVLELSSFQLYDLRYSPHIGVCLMVVPEHLNWHDSIEDYVHAKSQLFAHQTPTDLAIYFDGSETSKRIAEVSPGKKKPYYAAPGAHVEDGVIVIDGQRICGTGELKLLGQHNWQNACAAVTAAWQATQNVEAIRSVLTSFSGLEHRLEYVRNVDGVDYYDDSFGTTPETAIVAIQSFEKPKVVILGGSDKGAFFDELARTVAVSNVRAAILVGDTAPKIEAALRNAGYTNIVHGGTTMGEMVRNAADAAKAGDVVLLSNGCASFGLFENYKDRGEKFKAAVNAL